MIGSAFHDAINGDLTGSDALVDWTPVDGLYGEAIARGLLAGAVALAWLDDELVHATSQGWSDVATGRPMRSDCIFRLYSMTKPVTAVAMMILWDEGRWSPADLLADHLPELAGLRVLPEGAADDAALDALATPPTMEHLMTHQVGFAYGFGDDAADRLSRAAGVPALPHDITASDYLDRLARVPLAFQPGSGWRYGVAMDVQGVVIERLSGMSLREFMRRRIFEPLGMVDTDFVVPEGKRERLAGLYGLYGDRLVEMERSAEALEHADVSGLAPRDVILPYDDEPLLASGGGGLASTAADYLRFGRMLLGRGELEGTRIMSVEAAALMMRSHTPEHILAGGFGTAPHWLRPGYEYSYNGITVTDPERADVRLGRDTYFWDGAAGCWFWVDPENQVVFVSMIQLLTDAERLSLQLRSRDAVASVLEDYRMRRRRSASDGHGGD